MAQGSQAQQKTLVVVGTPAKNARSHNEIAGVADAMGSRPIIYRRSVGFLPTVHVATNRDIAGLVLEDDEPKVWRLAGVLKASGSPSERAHSAGRLDGSRDLLPTPLPPRP